MRAAAAMALAALLSGGAAFGQQITAARYIEPSTAYAHGAIKGGEYAALEVSLSSGQRVTLRYPDAIFEDTAPRLADLTGDGAPELVTVLSDFQSGARVLVLGLQDGQIVTIGATDPIGTRHRWLSIAGIADINGDGRGDIAYIDRPHLAKTLRIVTLASGQPGQGMVEIATAPALTNHHLGAAQIEGGVRVCPGKAPVIVTADANWAQIVETRFQAGQLISTPTGPYSGADSFASYLTCAD